MRKLPQLTSTQLNNLRENEIRFHQENKKKCKNPEHIAHHELKIRLLRSQIGR